MERDYGQEINELQHQLNKMKQHCAAIHKTKEESETKPLKSIRQMKNLHTDERLNHLMNELCAKADDSDETGAITYLGVFASGGRQSNWVRSQVSTDGLLRLMESSIASKVLTCIGSNERVGLLLALLKSPKTVAQLVEQCGYSSSGQVYHHLKPLLAVDLIKEDETERGCYAVVPHRVQGIIMILAGISDVLDPKYTEGNWEIE